MAVVAWMVFLGSLFAAQEPAIVGRVSLSSADGHTFRASGVRVSLTCEADRTLRFEISDDQGEFRFANVAADTCWIVADLQGFKPASATAITEVGAVTTLELQLNVEAVHTGMTVTGEPPPSRGARCHASHRAARGQGQIRSASRCST